MRAIVVSFFALGFVLLTMPIISAEPKHAIVPPAESAKAQPKAAPDGKAILVRTPYLSQPLGPGRQVTLYGVLGAEAQLVLDPNWCSLNHFGDPELCTEMALIIQRVKLRQVKEADPSGMGRSLYEVDGTPLSGRLYLVVPEDLLGGPYRLVHETVTGKRVVGAERVVWGKGDKSRPLPLGPGGIPIIELSPKSDCTRIGFNDARVVPGIVNGTYFLVVSGEKPNINMKVKLVPRIYVTQPDYWEFDLVGCVEGVAIPTTGRYVVDIPLQGVTGKRGVEVVGKNRKERLDVPPKPADEAR